MSKGGTSVSTTEIDPQLKAAYLQNLEQARSVAAGLPVQQFAGFNPMYRAGEEAAYNLGMTPFTAQSIQEFQNPYEQQVIQGTLSDIEQARQMQALRDAQQATQAKAFGGSRYGVQAALTNQGALQTAAKTAAQMRQAGYGQAAQLAQAARGMNLSGAQTAMQLGGARQQLEQAQLDAARNQALQQLQIAQGGLSLSLPNLGGQTQTPYYTNPAAGALGGALAGAQLGSIVPGIGTGIGAGIGGLLGLFGGK
jgi:hypothetical protein